jgi:hypothetical protein
MSALPAQPTLNRNLNTSETSHSRTHAPQQLPAYSTTSSARGVIVCRVRSQQMAKMPLAEDDNVVKTFPPDRTGGASRRSR